MSEENMIGIGMRVSSGGVDFHSAAALHDWMKTASEVEAWDEAPSLALLLWDDKEARVIVGEFTIAAEFQLKPWMVLREVAAALLAHGHKEQYPRPVVAACFFCEAWSYRVDASLMDDEGNIPANWKEFADPTRYETKTVMTVSVPPEQFFYSDRYRNITGWYDTAHIHIGGMVDVAMREVSKYLTRKTRGGSDPLEPSE